MTYRALIGFHYPASAAIDEQLRAAAALSDVERQAAVAEIRAAGGLRRVEVGEVVRDLPEASIAWMLEQGVIEAAARPGRAPIPAVIADAVQPEEPRTDD